MTTDRLATLRTPEEMHALPDAPDFMVAACANPAFPGGGDGRFIAKIIWANLAAAGVTVAQPAPDAMFGDCGWGANHDPHWECRGLAQPAPDAQPAETEMCDNHPMVSLKDCHCRQFDINNGAAQPAPDWDKGLPTLALDVIEAWDRGATNNEMQIRIEHLRGRLAQPTEGLDEPTGMELTTAEIKAKWEAIGASQPAPDPLPPSFVSDAARRIIADDLYAFGLTSPAIERDRTQPTPDEP